MKDTHVGKERDGERVESRRTSATTFLAQRKKAGTGSDRRTRRGVVDSGNARPRARCRASPMPRSHCTAATRGSAGPSKKVATPATECEVELLEGRRIISNELETDGGARENIGNENRRREGKRETFTKATSAGLVKETIPARPDEVDVRAPRKGGRKDNAQRPGLLDQRQGNAAKMYTAVQATAQRTKDRCGGLDGADTHRETPANALSMHSVQSHLNVSL